MSDFYRHLVLRVSVDGQADEVLEVEGQPSGLGWMPDGSMLVVSMRDHRILRWSADGGVSEHADVSQYCGGQLNGRTLLICAAPDFHEESRVAAREAVLLTTEVDVPRAGLP